jgi:hypothetical protein
MFWKKRKLPAALLLVAVVAGAIGVWMVLASLAGRVKANEGLDALNDGQRPTVAALLYVAREPLRILQEETPGRRADDTEFTNYRRTQAALLRSRLVINAALKQPKVTELSLVRTAKDPIGWLVRALRIDFPGDGEILRVGLDGSQIAELALLLDGIVDAYLHEIVNKEHQKRVERVNQLEKLYSQKADELQRKRRQLRSLQESSDSGSGGLSPSGEEQLFVHRMLDQDRELRRVQLEKTAAETRLARLRAKLPAGETRSAAYRDLEEQIAILAAQDKLLHEVEPRMRNEDLRRQRPHASLELQSVADEIHCLEHLSERLAAELEARKIELEAPPRVRLLEAACGP